MNGLSQNRKSRLDICGRRPYQGCLRDLENSLKVVRVGGMIMGDDYYCQLLGVKKV